MAQLSETRGECLRTRPNTCTVQPHAHARKPSILDLPVEIIFNIVDAIFDTYPEEVWRGYGFPYKYWAVELDEQSEETWPHFDVWKDLVRLMYTCKTLYNATWPMLYRKDAKYNESSALVLSAMKGNLAGVTKSLMQGGDVFAAYREFKDRECFVHDGSWIGTRAMERTTVWYYDIHAVHLAAFNRDCQILRHIHDAGSIDDIQDTDALFTTKKRFICKSLNAVLKQFEPSINLPILKIPSSDEWTDRRMISYLKSILNKGSNVYYFALINVSSKRYRENWVSTSARETLETLVESLRSFSISSSWAEAMGILVESDSSDPCLITHFGTQLHALHQACGGRDIDAARFILEGTTTSVDIRDAFDNTPLHHVAMCKRSKEDADDPLTTDPRPIIQLLLLHGADINARNLAGHTPLQECFSPPDSMYPNIDVAVALLREGAATLTSLKDLIEEIGIEPDDEKKLIAAWTKPTAPHINATSPEIFESERHTKCTKAL